MNKEIHKIILYADDDPDDRELLTATLQELHPDYKIIPAGNGKEAIKKLKELMAKNIKPCLIVLDMNMPMLNGKETLEIIKSNPDWSGLPVAIFTTASSKMYKDLMEKYGIPVITKPAKFKTMVNEVAQLLSCCSRC